MHHQRTPMHIDGANLSITKEDAYTLWGDRNRVDQHFKILDMNKDDVLTGYEVCMVHLDFEYYCSDHIKQNIMKVDEDGDMMLNDHEFNALEKEMNPADF